MIGRISLVLFALAGGAVWTGVPSRSAGAQGLATLSGRISADSGGGVVRSAGIRIPQLDRVVAADSAGAFRVEQLPAGAYVVIAEAPGFRARQSRLTLAAGATVTQDFVLSRSAQILAGIDVRAKAPPRATPKMADFERRRQRGNGKFVSRAELDVYTPGTSRQYITRAELRRATVLSALDAGQTLRPEWLAPSLSATPASVVDASPSGSEAPAIAVYVINTRLPGPESLADISIPEIEELRLYDAGEAQRRWGAAHPLGAIEVVPATERWVR